MNVVGALPPNVRLLNCFTCGLSDYSPYGHGLFGDVDCYRSDKTAYRRVATKWDLLQVRSAGKVQETHLCPEWEGRPPGRGYRG